MDMEKVIKGLECCSNGCSQDCPYFEVGDCNNLLAKDALDLLKEQETEIRQLRLALDIAKGTCKGIKAEGR